MERLVSLNRIHNTSLVTNSSNARSEKLSQGVIFFVFKDNLDRDLPDSKPAHSAIDSDRQTGRQRCDRLQPVVQQTRLTQGDR